ncbi:unnamed protein product [Cyclocybe aegerita]|uniref:Uncharacterized protein n=1 Tax=Cyclocybe aegerita TaxID=1973307 RepID=A0A8S0WNV8_CYCAE|nr:unnamed protein product [Cyclocybe aegerita]
MFLRKTSPTLKAVRQSERRKPEIEDTCQPFVVQIKRTDSAHSDARHVLRRASAADSPFEEPLIAPECSETSSAMITPAVQRQAQQGSSIPSVDLVAESSPRSNKEVGVASWSTYIEPATSAFVVHDASCVPLPESPLIEG